MIHQKRKNRFLGIMFSLMVWWGLFFLGADVSFGATSTEKGGPVLRTSQVTSSLSVTPFLQDISSDLPQKSIDFPSQGGKRTMILSARGKETKHFWSVLQIQNDQSESRVLVVSVSHASLWGAGIFASVIPGSLLQNFQVSLARSAQTVPALGGDALLLRVPPLETVIVAMELKAPPRMPLVSLWTKTSWDREMALRPFFNGAILGGGVFLVFFLFVVFCFVPRRELFFLALWWMIGMGPFLAIEMGYGPILQGWIRLGEPLVRLWSEAGILIGALLLFLTGHSMRPPFLKGVGIAIILLTVSFCALGVYVPHIALFFLRLLFGGAILGLLGVLVWYASRGGGRVFYTFPLWFSFTAWVFLISARFIGIFPKGVCDLFIPLGGVFVFALACLTVVGGTSFGRLFFKTDTLDDLSRRALALKATDQVIWEWNPEHRVLFVGKELERMVGCSLGRLVDDDLNAWFETIHPADRLAYHVAIESLEKRGRGVLSQDFRLRRPDGTYRWYQVRARVVFSGEDFGVLRMIGTLTDITVLRRREDRLLSDAIHDQITGLPHRALFLDRLERLFAQGDPRTLPHGRSVQILILDLDRFKTVNDGLGYEVGDRLLQITARRLLSVLTPQDTLARLSGDQFGILWDNRTGDRHVLTCAEEMRRVVAQPIRLRTQEIFLTASIGISGEWLPQMKGQDFLKTGEVALYEAKRKGKNTIAFFHPDIADERGYFVKLEHDLRRALERNEIEVVYQPIVDVATRSLAGFEALLRWRHPSGEEIGPSIFISIAEDTGMIHALGRYVLVEAARHLGVWQRALRLEHGLFVSVNLSCAQLLNADLVEDLRGILSREDLAPQSLKLELTESLLMQNPELSLKILSRLKDLGVGLACDDFGTGYSSLSHLRRIPFDTLKMDRSFLEEDPEEDRASLILESMILLAHDLGLKVIAEGIEHEDHFLKVEKMGADLAQGFFIGGPLTSQHVMEIFAGTSALKSQGGLVSSFEKRFGLFGKGKRRFQDESQDRSSPLQDPFQEKQETDEKSFSEKPSLSQPEREGEPESVLGQNATLKEVPSPPMPNKVPLGADSPQNEGPVPSVPVGFLGTFSQEGGPRRVYKKNFVPTKHFPRRTQKEPPSDSRSLVSKHVDETSGVNESASPHDA